MFTLVSDETSQNLGIEVHQLRFYAFETSLLAGKAVHDSTAKNFSVLVSPHIEAMKEIATGDPEILRFSFDKARTQHLAIGTFPSLDAVDMAIRGLNNAYETILKHFGAAGRMLIEESNSRALVEDPAASNARYGDAIITARTLQAFRMMEQNEQLDFRTTVGKIMPVFLTALGLKEYQVGQDMAKDGTGKVQFVIDRVAMFEFYPPKDDNGTTLIKRYTSSNGKYLLTAMGEAEGNFIRKHVFEWLVEAARDLNVIDENIEKSLGQIEKTLRDNLVLKKSTPLFREGENVVVFRPR